MSVASNRLLRQVLRYSKPEILMRQLATVTDDGKPSMDEAT